MQKHTGGRETLRCQETSQNVVLASLRIGDGNQYENYQMNKLI